MSDKTNIIARKSEKRTIQVDRNTVTTGKKLYKKLEKIKNSKNQRSFQTTIQMLVNFYESEKGLIEEE